MSDSVVIDAIHRARRVAILEDGTLVPMDVLLDRDGDETDDIEAAVAAVAPLPDGRWAVIDFTQFPDGSPLQ